MAHTTRRTFLRDSLILSTGALAGGWLSSNMSSTSAFPSAATQTVDAEANLKRLGITLPPPPKPVAVYVPAVVTGNLLFASGHGPRTVEGKLLQGKVGDTLTLAQGQAAARVVGLNVLSSIRATVGSLNRVARLVKVLGMVNATPDFAQHPQVINGFSQLMVEVFGEQHGKGARSAVGMGSLPSNIPVEIEAIFELRS